MTSRCICCGIVGSGHVGGRWSTSRRNASPEVVSFSATHHEDVTLVGDGPAKQCRVEARESGRVGTVDDEVVQAPSHFRILPAVRPRVGLLPRTAPFMPFTTRRRLRFGNGTELFGRTPGSEAVMAEGTTYATPYDEPGHEGDLKRSITGPQLFFYTLGDVLGSGIYVLIGLVAAAVGGAFWIAFAVGVTVAAITGTAYAELVTKYPQAAGAALYVNKAFGNKALTFLITVSFLSASFAAAGALADGFSPYFATLWAGPPALLVTLVFIAGAEHRQLHRHHRVGRHQHADGLRRDRRPDHRADHRDLVHRRGQRGLRGADRVRDRGRHQPRAGDPRRCRALVLRDDRLREHRERRGGDDRPAPLVPALPDRRHDHRRRDLRAGLDGGGADRADRRRWPTPTPRCSRSSRPASCRSTPAS